MRAIASRCIAQWSVGGLCRVGDGDPLAADGDQLGGVACDGEASAAALAVADGVGDGVESAGAESVLAGAAFDEQFAQQAGEDGAWEVAKLRPVDGGIWAALLDCLASGLFDRVLVMLAEGGEVVGEFDGPAGRVGSQIAQDGQHLVAQAGAPAGGVGVGVVLAPGLVDSAEPGLDLLATEREHGADQGDGDGGLMWQGESAFPSDAAQTADGGAADHPHEQCFELIVGLVSGDDGGISLAGERGEGVIAEHAGASLEVAGLVGRADVL